MNILFFVKGTLPEYLRTICEEWNNDMRALDINDRLSLYANMVATSKEKFVHGFDFVRCKKPGGEWVVTCHLNVIDYSEKERSQQYPLSTTERDSDVLEETALDYEYEVNILRPYGKQVASVEKIHHLQKGNVTEDTCDLLAPDISLRTGSDVSLVLYQSTSKSSSELEKERQQYTLPKEAMEGESGMDVEEGKSDTTRGSQSETSSIPGTSQQEPGPVDRSRSVPSESAEKSLSAHPGEEAAPAITPLEFRRQDASTGQPDTLQPGDEDSIGTSGSQQDPLAITAADKESAPKAKSTESSSTSGPMSAPSRGKYSHQYDNRWILFWHFFHTLQVELQWRLRHQCTTSHKGKMQGQGRAARQVKARFFRGPNSAQS